MIYNNMIVSNKYLIFKVKWALIIIIIKDLMPCWPQLIAFSVSSRGTYCLVFNISRSEPSFLRHDRLSWRRICGCYAASPAICKATVGENRHFIIITIKSYYLCPYSDPESLLLGSCSRSYLMTFNCFDLYRTLLVAFHS